MGSVRRFTGRNRKRFELRLVALPVMEIGDETMSLTFLAVSSRGAYVWYIEICQMMNKHKATFFCLSLWAQTRQPQGFWILRHFMNPVSSFLLEMQSSSWFRPTSRSSKTTSRLSLPQKWFYKHDRAVFNELYARHPEQGKYKFPACALLCETDIDQTKLISHQSKTLFYTTKCAIYISKRSRWKRYERRWSTQNASFVDDRESFQSCAKLLFQASQFRRT